MTDTPSLVCSAYSLEAGEQLFGTATNVATWFLLEYDGRWEREAFDLSDIPAPVKEYLEQQAKAVPRPRIQTIRQKPCLAPEGIAFFVGLGRESSPAIYEFHLDRYEDLLSLDLPAICAGDAAYDRFRRVGPLFLVCTHGRRDPCCARHGVAAYDPMVEAAGAAVWQTSHLGGHRFAANVVCFPHGIYYGRVRAESVKAILDAYRAGQIVPGHYRGRACYAGAVQAADYFLRNEVGSTALDAFRFEQTDTAGPQWSIRFKADAGSYLLTLEEQPAALQVYSSCSDAVPGPVSQFRLINLAGPR